MNAIAMLRTALVGLVIGIVVGALGGFYTHAKFTQAAQVSETAQARSQDAQSVSQSQINTLAVQAEVRKSDNHIGAIKKEIRNHAGLGKTVVCPPTVQPENLPAVLAGSDPGAGTVPVGSVDDAFLSRGAVGLLRCAREGATVCPFPTWDGEGGTASDVPIDALIEDDLELTRLYNELAIKHNRLVDDVLEFQAQQRQRLNP